MSKTWDRVTGFCCDTCMHFAPQVNSPTGRCRRHAPTMQGYPVVYALTDWCGDHKLGTNPSKMRLQAPVVVGDLKMFTFVCMECGSEHECPDSLRREFGSAFECGKCQNKTFTVKEPNPS